MTTQRTNPKAVIAKPHTPPPTDPIKIITEGAEPKPTDPALSTEDINITNKQK